MAAAGETLDAAPDGPVTPEMAASLANPRLTLVSWMMAGGDLAILFLMLFTLVACEADEDGSYRVRCRCLLGGFDSHAA